MARLRVAKKVKPNIEGYILVDIDSSRSGKLHFGHIFRLLRIMGIVADFVRYDRTKRGWHIIVKPKKPMQRWQILLAQATLGDDPIRSAYNYQRLKNKVWLNQLFEATK